MCLPRSTILFVSLDDNSSRYNVGLFTPPTLEELSPIDTQPDAPSDGLPLPVFGSSALRVPNYRPNFPQNDRLATADQRCFHGQDGRRSDPIVRRIDIISAIDVFAKCRCPLSSWRNWKMSRRQRRKPADHRLSVLMRRPGGRQKVERRRTGGNRRKSSPSSSIRSNAMSTAASP
jgi:hypothetical protein